MFCNIVDLMNAVLRSYFFQFYGDPKISIMIAQLASEQWRIIDYMNFYNFVISSCWKLQKFTQYY